MLGVDSTSERLLLRYGGGRERGIATATFCFPVFSNSYEVHKYEVDFTPATPTQTYIQTRMQRAEGMKNKSTIPTKHPQPRHSIHEVT